MKQAMIFVAAAVAGTALVLGIMMLAEKPLPFKDMPGAFKCKDFGLPDKTFDRLMITPEMTLVGMAGDRQMTIGRLAPRDVGAELEYSMEVVHFSSFNLDPFTAPRLFAFKNSLALSARENEKDFTVNCERIK
jgi:hypothetical protein